MESSGKIEIKVCGITRLQDALALDALGVEYLGFNFWKGSKRFIKPADAAAIIRQLKRAIPVGVFVNHAADEIEAISQETKIKFAQLHGAETWDILDKISLPVIKAIPHTRLDDWGGLRAGWDGHAGKQPRYFLVDTQAGTEFGGTGAVFDWNLLAAGQLPRPYFLAGGIGPENIAAAKKRGPHGMVAVDLNSKVETAPGVKDVAKVAACFTALRSTEG